MITTYVILYKLFSLENSEGTLVKKKKKKQQLDFNVEIDVFAMSKIRGDRFSLQTEDIYRGRVFPQIGSGYQQPGG